MGALAHFQAGGGVSDDPYDDYDDDGYDDGSGDYAPTGAGALAQAPADDEIARYQQLGGALSGSPQEVTGALSRQRQSVDDAYAQKRAALERAMGILRASGQRPQANLPLLMAGAAMMGPSGSFGESVQNAANAAAPYIERQRQGDEARDLGLSKLDVAGADLGIEQAKEHQSDWLNQQKIGEQYLRYAATLRQRQDAAKAREESAKALQAYRDRMAAARDEANRLREEDQKNGSFAWQTGPGPDPQDPNKQVPGAWRLPTAKASPDAKPEFFPGVTGRSPTGRGGAGNAPALTQTIDYMVKHGIAKDEKEAYSMVSTAKTNPRAHQLLVTKLMDTIQKNELIPGTKSMPQIAQEAEEQARQIEAVSGPQQQQPVPTSSPGGVNTAANPGFNINMPLPQRAAPTAAAAPAAAPLAAPPPMAQRVQGKVYPTPKGPMKWTAKGWIPAQ